MNELNLALANIVKHSDKTVLGTTDKVINQFPEIATQIVKFGIFDSIFCALVFFAIVALCIFAIKYFLKCIKEYDKNNDDTSGWWLGLVFVSIFSFIFFIIGCSRIEDLAKCVLAPKLYVTEQVITTLKGEK